MPAAEKIVSMALVVLGMYSPVFLYSSRHTTNDVVNITTTTFTSLGHFLVPSLTRSIWKPRPILRICLDGETTHDHLVGR